MEQEIPWIEPVYKGAELPFALHPGSSASKSQHRPSRRPMLFVF